MTELNLRNATERDEEVVLSLLMDMHKESGLGSVNKDRVNKAIRHCRELGCILIAEVQGVPKAVLGLRPDRFWWSDDFGLFDQFTYVAPEARKTRAIFKLVDAAKSMAKEAGIPLVIANFGVVDTKAKSRLYKTFGKELGVTVITGETSHFLWR